MTVRDRLIKAKRKLQEHFDVCKTCSNTINKFSTCTIAHQLNENIKRIK